MTNKNEIYDAFADLQQRLDDEEWSHEDLEDEVRSLSGKVERLEASNKEISARLEQALDMLDQKTELYELSLAKIAAANKGARQLAMQTLVSLKAASINSREVEATP